MQFPRKVYKNGILSAEAGAARPVNSPREMFLALEDDYWSHYCDTKEEAEELPCLKQFLKDEKEKLEKAKNFERIIQKSTQKELIKDELQIEYEKETGKNALCDRGPHKGTPTTEFKKWKETNHAS